MNVESARIKCIESAQKLRDNVQIYTSKECILWMRLLLLMCVENKWQMMFWWTLWLSLLLLLLVVMVIVTFWSEINIRYTQWSTLFNGNGLSRSKHAADTRLHDFNHRHFNSLTHCSLCCFESPKWQNKWTIHFEAESNLLFFWLDLRKLHGATTTNFNFPKRMIGDAAKKRNSKNNKWYPKSLFVFFLVFSLFFSLFVCFSLSFSSPSIISETFQTQHWALGESDETINKAKRNKNKDSNTRMLRAQAHVYSWNTIQFIFFLLCRWILSHSFTHFGNVSAYTTASGYCAMCYQLIAPFYLLLL